MLNFVYQTNGQRILCPSYISCGLHYNLKILSYIYFFNLYTFKEKKKKETLKLLTIITFIYEMIQALHHVRYFILYPETI